MPIAWNAGMETGNRQIDLQHRELIDHINQLEKMCGASIDDDALEEILSHLTVYVLFHFATEELLMGTAPGHESPISMHIREHRKFARWLNDFKDLPRPDQKLGLPGMHQFLQAWLTEHILTSDRQLIELVGDSRI